MSDDAREAAWTAFVARKVEGESAEAALNAAIDAFMAVLERAHVVVPREPTEAILSAGAHVIRDIGERRFLVGSVMADEIYRTMLKAAEEQQSQGRS
jgi:hypothetical protein